METVLEKIRAERKRQDNKWGEDRELDPYVWLAILVEEVGEVAKSILEDKPNETEKETVQVSAVGTAWLEGMERRRLTPRALDFAICAPEYHTLLDEQGDRFCRMCGRPLSQ